MQRICLITMLLLISRGADVAVTYLYTPDLKLEGNPLAVTLGWPGMIAMSVAGIILLVSGLVYWYRKPIPCTYHPKIMDVWSHASFSYFGKVMPRRQFFLRTIFSSPNWKYVSYALFSTMPQAWIGVSAYTVFSWQMLHYYPLGSFRHLYKTTYPLSLFLPIFLVFLAVVFDFHRSEYKRYLLVCNNTSQLPAQDCSAAMISDRTII